MAGITYLYGLWNINMLGDSTVAPNLMEAHLDIQACLSVLEALSGGSWTVDSVGGEEGRLTRHLSHVLPTSFQ
jgi:hypothetical protein